MNLSITNIFSVIKSTSNKHRKNFFGIHKFNPTKIHQEFHRFYLNRTTKKQEKSFTSAESSISEGESPLPKEEICEKINIIPESKENNEINPKNNSEKGYIRKISLTVRDQTSTPLHFPSTHHLNLNTYRQSISHTPKKLSINPSESEEFALVDQLLTVPSNNDINSPMISNIKIKRVSTIRIPEVLENSFVKKELNHSISGHIHTGRISQFDLGNIKQKINSEDKFENHKIIFDMYKDNIFDRGESKKLDSSFRKLKTLTEEELKNKGSLKK